MRVTQRVVAMETGRSAEDIYSLFLHVNPAFITDPMGDRRHSALRNKNLTNNSRKSWAARGGLGWQLACPLTLPSLPRPVAASLVHSGRRNRRLQCHKVPSLSRSSMVRTGSLNRQRFGHGAVASAGGTLGAEATGLQRPGLGYACEWQQGERGPCPRSSL